MDAYDLQSVHVALVDRDSGIRRLIRGILARYGIVGFTECTSVQEVGSALNGVLPDLMIIDADPADGDGLKFIHAVRHGQGALNPFVGIIATTWQPTSALMMRFTASGADDLLVKPFSAKQVQDRLTNLVEARRKFVVTGDYIGPDRRRQPREDQSLPLVEVPNTLRQKATGCFDKARVGDQIAGALAEINAQKVVREAFHIAFLVMFALPGLDRTPPDRMATDHLLRAAATLDDLLRRLPEGESRTQIESHAAALRRSIERQRAALDRPLDDAAGLRRSALQLAATVAGRGDIDHLEQEVSAAVRAYRNRLDQLAQAKAGQASGAETAAI